MCFALSFFRENNLKEGLKFRGGYAIILVYFETTVSHGG